MPARTLARPALRPALLTGGAVSAATAVVLWTIAMFREWPLLNAGGVICGAQAGLLGHCSACYPAMAATVVAIGFAIALFAQGRGRAKPRRRIARG